ncbi:MAG: MFS transporter [Candidatus Tectomicrobia bacterium]|uniref:MFS transporter n=1 Tax=Tectimicrobiota bacterium TaxID=2528274 RepID=A0A933LQ06_UNCTE|nr:MFS transporter [Candidatus Tectomicrobia bacterium]
MKKYKNDINSSYNLMEPGYNRIGIRDDMRNSKIFYGWWVVWATFVLLILAYGVRGSFGIYLKPISQALEWNRAAVSGAFSIYLMVYSLGAFLMGGLTDRYGPRFVMAMGAFFIGLGLILAGGVTSVWQWYFTYGVLTGIGCSAMYVPSVATISKYFIRKRGLALGIATAGCGLGPTLLNPLSYLLIEAYAWKSALVLTGIGVIAIGIALPLLILKGKGLPEEMGLLPDGDKAVGTSIKEDAGQEAKSIAPNLKGTEALQQNQMTEDYSLGRALRTLPFWMFFIMYFSWTLIADGLIYVHLAAYLNDLGISAGNAAMALGSMNLIFTVSMIILGFMGDHINRRILLILLFVLQTVSMGWLLMESSSGMLYGFVIIYGLAVGGIVPCSAGLLSDIFGRKSISSILGAATIALGLSGLLGPWLAGYIFDVTHSYSLVWQSSFVVSLLGTVASFYIRVTKKMTSLETLRDQ